MRFPRQYSNCAALLRESQFQLLLIQIVCRRLNFGRGIVRARVGFSYDSLRFCPFPTICPIHPPVIYSLLGYKYEHIYALAHAFIYI